MEDSGSAYEISDSESYDSGDYERSLHAQPVVRISGLREYTIISPTELAKAQEEALQSVCSILGCTRSSARKLLMHHRWNTEALFGVLAERGENYVSKEAGIACISSQQDQTDFTVSSSSGKCGTCFCDLLESESTVMECGHCFCNDCWKHHFLIQVQDGNSRTLRCMAFRCTAQCSEEKVILLLEDQPEASERYKSSLLGSYVEDNALVCWCPTVPHCGRAIRVEQDPHCQPICSCGHIFCFACGEEPHSPCTCVMWRQWKQKTQDDSETKNWMTANTKPCPKCSKPVQKEGGCNLVVCTCRQGFCWLCGAATGYAHTWHTIEKHTCGAYKEAADQKISEAVRSMQRYHHYFSRWEAHMKSGKAELEQKKQLEEAIASMEQIRGTYKDYDWLEKGLDQLLLARRILGYSYVFAFFMFGNSMFKEEISSNQNEINKNLFENQQQEMENLIENLSETLETPLFENRQAEETRRVVVINFTVNLNKRLENLYELIENDLLGSLQFSPNDIAPYKGKSAQKLTPAESKFGSIMLPPIHEQEKVIDLCSENDTLTPNQVSEGKEKRPRLLPF